MTVEVDERAAFLRHGPGQFGVGRERAVVVGERRGHIVAVVQHQPTGDIGVTVARVEDDGAVEGGDGRSEEHTSELQSLMRISYAVFCLKKKKKETTSTQ